MKLILHIGMHKTGTTALQAALADHRTSLLRHGVLYPRVSFHPTNHNFLARLLLEEDARPTRGLLSLYGEQAHSLTKTFLESGWAQIKHQVDKHEPHTVILSGENMFRGLGTGDPVAFKARLLELTDDIQVIAYVRQPSRHYLSAIQQDLKASSRFPPPAAASIRKTLETSEQLFGRRPKVLAYERGLLQEGDITSDFLDHLFPKLGPVIPRASSAVLNESLSAESMAILQDYRCVNYPEADDHFTVDSVRLRRLLQRIEQRHGLYRRPALIAEVGHYIDQASVDLLWLEENYGIRFQGVDYSAIKEFPENPYQSLNKVSDICVVDAAHKQRILMLAAHALLPQRWFKLPNRLRMWAHKNYGGSQILQRARAGLRRLRDSFVR